MTATTRALPDLVGGADTHADTIHVAAIDRLGQDLGDTEFPTTAAGYEAALAFLSALGTVTVLGVEGSSSYGAGLAHAARSAGIEVREVTRPDRAHRRRRGKSDSIDAYEAARATLSGRADAAAKLQRIEAIRALHNSRRSAVKAGTAAMNQIHQMLINSPDTVRERYRRLAGKALVNALAGSRPAVCSDPVARAVLTALKALAKRHQFLSGQAEELARQLRELTRVANPHLLSLRGVGSNTAAALLITAGANPSRLHSESSFAALCGAAPVPASSGRTTRHRLSRGGDRRANHALHTIALVRMSNDARTRDYVNAQRHKGRNDPEILRMLKRAIAREVFRSLTRDLAPPQLADLRPLRQSKNITLTAAAAAMHTYITKITRTEKGTFPDYDLAQRYRTWLQAA
jgi:transposase